MKLIPLRFSLASLLGAIGVIAFACAALRYASAFWASLTFTLCLGMLCFSILGGLFRDGRARVFWIGFSVFGWSYLLMVFGPWFADNIKGQLLTTKLLAALHQKAGLAASGAAGVGTVFADLDNDGSTDLYVASDGQPNQLYKNAGNGQFVNVSGQVGMGVASGDFDGDGRVDLFLTNFTGPAWEHFERVGHSLFALLVALLGGLLAVFLARSRKPPMRPTAHAP